MAVFRYKALDSSGNELSNTVEAGNSREAIGKLRDLGLFPTKVTLVSGQGVADIKKSNTANGKRSEVLILCKKCKLKRGFETTRGSVGICGEKGEMYVTFKPAQSDLRACDEISISFKDIIEVERKGLLGRSVVVKTKRDGELTFTGNISRLAIVLKMETKNNAGGSG